MPRFKAALARTCSTEVSLISNRIPYLWQLQGLGGFFAFKKDNSASLFLKAFVVASNENYIVPLTCLVDGSVFDHLSITNSHINILPFLSMIPKDKQLP